MTATTYLASKVLLLEHDKAHYQALLTFCRESGLIALPRSAADAVSTLEQHHDLGGVLLSEDLPSGEAGALSLAQTIHRARPELPIFLRRTGDQPLDPAESAACSHTWRSGDLAELRQQIEHSIYTQRYPMELVDGVVELTRSAIQSMFPNAAVAHEPAYVVHDRIIFGEVSTLIALESTWCRGYMMLQTEERALRQGLLQGFGYAGVGGDLNFRELNHLLGETTNLIWGAFKNRYIPAAAFATQQTQVPIVINHAQKYISFGSQDPQLCVRWHLTDPHRPGLPPLTIVQRLIFNLHWSPEAFAEFAARPVSSSETGELELF